MSALSQSEARWLDWIAQHQLACAMVNGRPQHSVGADVVPVLVAKKLIRAQFVMLADPGLFDGMGQSWRARP